MAPVFMVAGLVGLALATAQLRIRLPRDELDRSAPEQDVDATDEAAPTGARARPLGAQT